MSGSVRTVEPEVAVTVTVDVPAGVPDVPGLVGLLGFIGLLSGLLPFPLLGFDVLPHPRHVINSTTMSTRLGFIL